MDEIIYEILCELCESETSITVANVDEKPAYCPMCGETIEIP